MNTTTKQRILQEAITLFARKGYDGVGVGEIAQAVGIKPPSLYKHYKSKEDIFNAIVMWMEERYRERVGGMQMDGVDANNDAMLFQHVSADALVLMGMDLFRYFLRDEYASKFRNILLISRHHNAQLSEMYVKQNFDDPLSYQGMLLGLLVQAGVLQEASPTIMAMQFYAPLYLLLMMCDMQPEREAEAFTLIEQHIRQFHHLYNRNEE